MRSCMISGLLATILAVLLATAMAHPNDQGFPSCAASSTHAR